MTEVRVLFAPGALTDISEARTWWQQNRPDAPELMADELASAFRELPAIASAIPCFRRVAGLDVRRVYVARVRRHAYFDVSSGGDVVVLAVWRAGP